MERLQIELDRELLDAVDRAVARLGMSRSGFTREALRRSLLRLRREALERKHYEGYARQPVAPDEFPLGD